MGTRFSYCAPVFGQFRGILVTFLNTELIFLRIPRELVIIYLCKRTPYGITALVFISICSSRPFLFTARKCFQKARLHPEWVLFLGVGALKAECLNRALEAASGGGESMRGDRTPGFFENKSMSLRMHFKPIFPYSIISTLSKVRHPSY